MRRVLRQSEAVGAHSQSGGLGVEFSILLQFEPEELGFILGSDGYLMLL